MGVMKPNSSSSSCKEESSLIKKEGVKSDVLTLYLFAHETC